jgi:hypothetical protein
MSCWDPKLHLQLVTAQSVKAFSASIVWRAGVMEIQWLVGSFDLHPNNQCVENWKQIPCREEEEPTLLKSELKIDCCDYDSWSRGNSSKVWTQDHKHPPIKNFSACQAQPANQATWWKSLLLKTSEKSCTRDAWTISQITSYYLKLPLFSQSSIIPISLETRPTRLSGISDLRAFCMQPQLLLWLLDGSLCYLPGDPQRGLC